MNTVAVLFLHQGEVMLRGDLRGRGAYGWHQRLLFIQGGLGTGSRGVTRSWSWTQLTQFGCKTHSVSERKGQRERESEREMEGSGLLHNFLHGQAQMNYVLTENTDNSQYLNTYAESRMSMITSTKTPNTLPNVFNESSATAERAKERETSLRPIVNYFSLLPARQNIPSACLRPK